MMVGIPKRQLGRRRQGLYYNLNEETQMNKKILLVLAGTLLMLVTATLGVRAQDARSPLPNVAHSRTVPPAHFRTLYSSAFESSNATNSVGGGFVALDGVVNINCKFAACTFEIDEHVQMGGSGAGNRWAICAQVDGSYLSTPSCPFLGYLNSDGSYLGGSFAQYASVTHGPHTAQVFTYTDAAATQSIYEITYRVYRGAP
jgi:hypothetical protein